VVSVKRCTFVLGFYSSTLPGSEISLDIMAPATRNKGKVRWRFFVFVVVGGLSCSKLLGWFSNLEHNHRDLEIPKFAWSSALYRHGRNTSSSSSSSFSSTGTPNGLFSSVGNSSKTASHDVSVLPTCFNTVIGVIAMGDTAQSNIGERFIASVRNGGEFDGYILLLTDAAGFAKYNATFSEQGGPNEYFKDAIVNHKTIVVPVWSEDLFPINNRTGKQLAFNGHMRYKRLKTVFDKYVEAYVDSRLSSHQAKEQEGAEKIRFILYLDVDNVVANPLDTLFWDYHKTISSKYTAIAEIITHNASIQWEDDPPSKQDFSFFSMWKEVTKVVDGSVQEWRWQGGQILQDRLFSKGCADAWRHQFDTHPTRKMDQGLLNNIVVRNFDEHRCKILELPTEHGTSDGKPIRKHYDKLEDYTLSLPERNLPTVIHITSRRTHEFTVKEQQELLRKALRIDQRQSPSTESGPKDEGLFDPQRIISVVNGKGQEY
jgi:hypothetical protein